VPSYFAREQSTSTPKKIHQFTQGEIKAKVTERDPTDQYLALCACQLTEAGRQGDAEVGVYLYFVLSLLCHILISKIPGSMV
jgi:hypothetical protein